MSLTIAQAQIVKDNHRFRVLRMGRRSGKTSVIIEEIKGLAISRPARIAFIATNYGQARDIAWDYLKRELQGAIIDKNEARLEIRVRTIDGEESIIILRGWESIEGLRGQAFDFLAIDEVASMRNFWENWQEVLRPTLTDRKGSVIFASTPKGYNHFYDLCNLELKDDTFKSFYFTSYDNPYLPVDEIDQAKQSLPSDTFAQEYLAEFYKSSGLVYKEFDRNTHLYDELKAYKELESLGAVDFGYTNPAAVCHILFDGEIYYVEDEWYKTQRTDAQIAEYVAGCKFKAVYPDPESPGAIEELRDRRVNVREVAKGKDSVRNGIQRVRELLLNGRLKINRKCVNLISEFETYSYQEGTEKPIDENNHLLDALRYLVSTHKQNSFDLIKRTTIFRDQTIDLWKD